MTVTYPLHEKINLYVKERISESDATRQRLTAQAILQRLSDQPGVILADEVGMGKTFVAITVAVSTALANRGNRPVVVMVPSSLKEKWPRDFELFCECCLPADLASKLQYGRAEKAVDFLKMLDDPKPKRNAVIFMTHGAMSRGLDDPWVMLALIQRSLHRRRNIAPLRLALGRHLGDLLRMKWLTKKDEGIWTRLLQTPTTEWLRHLSELSAEIDDDPVPAAIEALLPTLETDSIFEAIKRIPQRRTKHYNQNLIDARKVIAGELRQVWTVCLAKLQQRLPLLILDEAHHLKNSDTRLASLFHTEDAEADANEITQGPLSGFFERMLFLTATPFQLGHGELCSVLDRFDGIHWTGKSAPSMGRHGFMSLRKKLRLSLDCAQEAAVVLDHAWGQLRDDDLQVNGQVIADIHAWWSLVTTSDVVTSATKDVVASFQRTKLRMREAEILLQPWVIRHLKARHLNCHDSTPRRERRIGASILLEPTQPDGRGIAVSGEALLPFLLAARATACCAESRPVFAEGLASSYEAFLHTRNPDREGAVDLEIDSELASDATDSASWYLDNLDQLVAGRHKPGFEHPKVDATVKRALDYWKRGEKVVVFCHYIRTGRTLRQQISSAIQAEILQLGASKLNCSPEKVPDELKQIGDRFFDDNGLLKRACDEQTQQLLECHPKISPEHEALKSIVRRNLRTPPFLVRFYPLGSSQAPEELIRQAFAAKDQSGSTLRDLLRNFFAFLDSQCGTAQRASYIDALKRIQTGSHFGLDAAMDFENDELQGDTPQQLLPNVRLVNGSVGSETRQRLMLTFNTPFYPEVLVASSVLSEGVDLHLYCRHMIHHDLCWNPSNLEQRTGRIDRIGSKSERAGKPIQVFLPFVAETQDEKMYRVVMDRERWFNVVMGEDYRIDARTTDQLASRIPFPESAARELALNLAVVAEAEVELR